MKNREYLKSLIEKAEQDNKPSDRGNFKDCFIYDEFAVLKSSNINYGGKSFCISKNTFNPAKQQLATARIKKAGFNTPKIVYHQTKERYYFEVQEKAKGSPLFSIMTPWVSATKEQRKIKTQEHYQQNRARFIELLSAPTEQYTKFVENIFMGAKLEILDDCHSQNIFYDRENGFSFIDLPVLPYYETFEEYQELFSNFDDLIDLDNMNGYFLKAFSHFYNCGTCSDTDGYFYNLLAHKLVDGLKNSNIPLSERNKKFVIRNLLDPQLFESVSDSQQKGVLIKLGIITPTEIEKDKCAELLYYYNNQDNELYTEERDFYLDCIQNTTIEGIPAIEYFSSVNLHQSESSQNDYDM